MVATPSGLVMMIITMVMIAVMMIMLVFRKKRGAIDMLAGPWVIRNHDDYNEDDDYIQWLTMMMIVLLIEKGFNQYDGWSIRNQDDDNDQYDDDDDGWDGYSDNKNDNGVSY